MIRLPQNSPWHIDDSPALPLLPDGRRHSRQPRALTLRVRADAVPNHHAAVTDVSENGLCLKSASRFEVGQPVQFRLRMPEGTPVEGTARVRWVKENGPVHLQGLEIVRIGFWDRHRLGRYLLPHRFGVIEALDLALQFGFVATMLFSLQELWRSGPRAQQALLETLPLAMVLCGAVLVAHSCLKERLSPQK